MKKLLLGFPAGILTFCIGFTTVNNLSIYEFGITENTVRFSPPFMSGQRQNTAISKDGKIDIYFKEFISTEEGLTASFEAVNHHTKAAYYYAYLKDERNLLETEPFYKIDGVEQENIFCGNGLKTFKLNSGESVIFDVYAEQLKYNFENDNNNQIGFDFSIGKKRNYKVFWSDNLYLPAEIKAQLLRGAEERKLLNQ